MTKSKMANRYSPEVRAWAVRMVFEHQGSYETQAGAIEAIAPKIGCIPQTLSGWVKQVEKDSGGERWSFDFVSDTFGASRKFRMLAVNDDCCRENLFNNRRLLGLIGNIPPAQAEQNFYAQRDMLDMVT